MYFKSKMTINFMSENSEIQDSDSALLRPFLEEKCTSLNNEFDFAHLFNVAVKMVPM